MIILGILEYNTKLVRPFRPGFHTCTTCVSASSCVVYGCSTTTSTDRARPARDVIEVIKGSRTIRAFTSGPIPEEDINMLLEAAMWAPSHRNEQPWEFARVGPESRAKLLKMLQLKIDELLNSGKVPEPARPGLLSLKDDFGGAAQLIAVIARPGADILGTQQNFAATAGAAMNMQLAAWEKGIGSVWLTVGSVPPAKPILQAKSGHTVVALPALGYPKETPPAPPREDFRERVTELP
ncbi:hypothetical protein GF324_06770 [bacterium]|nr:hypothetical protein [bacterium]